MELKKLCSLFMNSDKVQIRTAEKILYEGYAINVFEQMQAEQILERYQVDVIRLCTSMRKRTKYIRDCVPIPDNYVLNEPVNRYELKDVTLEAMICIQIHEIVSDDVSIHEERREEHGDSTG